MIKDGSDNITIAFVAIDDQDTISSDYDQDYLTLKVENKPTTQIEDKILKRELYQRTNSDSQENPFSRIMVEKFSKLSGMAAVLILVIFLGVYAFSSHRDKHHSIPVNNPGYDSSSIVTTEDTIPAVGNGSGTIIQQPLDQLPELESKTVPESIVTRMITASIENKVDMNQVSNIQSRSLQGKLTDRGRIYLTGLEKFKDMENTTLFINNTYYGRTNAFWNRGVLLNPGLYTIIIKDSTNKILVLQKNIKLSAGDTKLIEIRGR